MHTQGRTAGCEISDTNGIAKGLFELFLYRIQLVHAQKNPGKVDTGNQG
jgi:hypothetical protein